MKKYHVAAGDGKGYYAVDYASHFFASELLKTVQGYDPQAHIVEEEYYFTHADRIRAMSDEELARWFFENLRWNCRFCSEDKRLENCLSSPGDGCDSKCVEHCLEWLQQPAEEMKEK